MQVARPFFGFSQQGIIKINFIAIEN